MYGRNAGMYVTMIGPSLGLLSALKPPEAPQLTRRRVICYW